MDEQFIWFKIKKVFINGNLVNAAKVINQRCQAMFKLKYVEFSERLMFMKNTEISFRNEYN